MANRHSSSVAVNPLAWQLHDYYDRLTRDAVAGLGRPATSEEWAAQKPALRERLADAVGFRPDWLPRVEAERLGVTPREGYTIERIAFHGWPNAPISADLYVPDGLSGPAPAIACPHGHSMAGKAYSVYQHTYINLARRGYVVLAWDNIGHGERAAMNHRDGHWALLAGLSLKGMMLTEAQALVTWLMEQDEVDAARIGCTGNSGGGAQTLLLAALDERIAAAAPAGHTSPLSFISDKEKKLCPCTILPSALQFAEVDHVLGLIAPRPALIVSGRDDCLFPEDLTRRAFRLGRRFYALERADRALELFVGACGHGYEQPKREAMYAFFDRVLKGEDVATAAEPPTLPEPEDSPALMCWPDAKPVFATVRDLAQALSERQACSRVIHRPSSPHVAAAIAEREPQADGWERVRFDLSNGITLPARAAGLEAETLAIVIDDRGKDSGRATQLANEARGRREGAVALDLLGWGETRPEELPGKCGDDESFAAQRGVFLGRPLLAERAAQLAAITDALAAETGATSITWRLCGWASLLADAARSACTVAPAIVVHEPAIGGRWDEADGRPVWTFAGLG